MIRVIATLLAYAVLSFPMNVHAQSYPKQAINLLIPLAPGDATDVAGRTIGEGLSKLLKVPVVAINKPGGGGTVTAELSIRLAVSEGVSHATAVETDDGWIIEPSETPDGAREYECNVGTGTSDYAMVPTDNLLNVLNYDPVAQYPAGALLYLKPNECDPSWYEIVSGSCASYAD